MAKSEGQVISRKGRGETKFTWLGDTHDPLLTSWKRRKPVQTNSTKLSSLVGKIGRDVKILTVHISSWKQMPSERKEEAVRNIRKHFLIPDDNIKWVLESLNRAWRDQKYEFKRLHFYPFSTSGERIRNRPKVVPLDSWRLLVKLWEDDKNAEKAEKNKENRKKLTMPHTGGSKNYAKHAIEIEEDPERIAPTGTPATQVEVFIKTHTKKDNTPVTTQADEKMKEMRDRVAKNTQDGIPIQQDGPDPIFAEVMGPESRGFIRCYGKGTPKTIWGESSTTKSRNSNEEDPNEKKMEEMKNELDSTRAELAAIKDYLRNLHNKEQHVSTPELSFGSTPTDPSSSTH